ncbi:hypothetical protein K8I31_09985, partial [bacterium]|nr:hypothetical protein [bacterium]
MTKLNKPENLEWLDWDGTANTGRRLDWSETPTEIKPQLCLNSEAVLAAVSGRAALIGEEISTGQKKLIAEGKADLLIGVIAGWETQMGRDFDTGSRLGYCALINKGYSAQNPPDDLDRARSQIVNEYISFWARSLAEAGAPQEKIYSHIAFMSKTMYELALQNNPSQITGSYIETVNFSPPDTAFCPLCIPGISTYPQAGHLEEWRDELKKQGKTAWASSEGSPFMPENESTGEIGMDMEPYLGNLYNHGAQLVTIFGWGVGPEDNPFRKAAENENSIHAYQKVLRGEPLNEAAIPIPNIMPEGLAQKIHTISAILPDWIEQNGPDRV